MKIPNFAVTTRRLQKMVSFSDRKNLKILIVKPISCKGFKPALPRWLDAVLVVETSPAYGIWQKTIKEFRNLLLNQGIFRDVKCWYAKLEEDRLVFRSQQGSIRSPKELVLPSGDCIIIIVSDCVSSAWSVPVMLLSEHPKIPRNWLA